MLKIQLLPVKGLKPHEEISEKNYFTVLQDILNEQIIYNPLIVDLKTNVILDGHHRFTVAKRLNFPKLPCLTVDYFDDSIISVFPRRDNIFITKQLVITAGITGNLFPNKSTRHVLNVDYSPKPYPLDLLADKHYLESFFLF